MLNIAIDIFATAVSAVGLILSIIASRVNHLVKKHFIVAFITMALYVLSNLVGLIFRGVPGNQSRAILYTVNFCEFLFPNILTMHMSRYLVEITISDEKKQKRLKRCFLAILILHILSLIVSQFTGLYYIIDENNFYVRSPLHPLSYVCSGLMMMADIGIILNSRKTLSMKQKVAFWAYLIAPILGILLQMQVYGINFVTVTVVMAAISMFVLIAMDQRERSIRAEMEKEIVKSSLLLGQISPHFIFNSLMTIQDLCYSDPSIAAKAIGDFAVYLRHNMEDLTNKETVSFEKELDFVREYISLEKTDPDRDFEVSYDLKATDFRIPTLTLQPIVENAVNYGALTCKEKKGEVRISTREENGYICIYVWNNYEGHRSVTEGQKKHRSIAIENVRSRLKYYCEGTFDIDIGETEATALIRMPSDKVKGEVEIADDHDR